MLSLSRASGESLDILIDYDQDPELATYVRRLGGSLDDLRRLSCSMRIKFFGFRRSGPNILETVVSIDAPHYIKVWRSELRNTG